MKGKYVALCVFLLLISCVPLFAASLEVRSGDFKLILYEDLGTFALYFLSDAPKNRYEPLLSDRNFSRNSAFFINLEDKVLKLQKTFGVQVKAEKTEVGARFVFNIPSYFDTPIQVVQDFIFISPTGLGFSEETTAVYIELQVIPSKNVFRSCSIRAVLDTHLGESDSLHFSSDRFDRLSSETLITPSTEDTWLLSSGKTARFRVLFGADGFADTKEPTAVVVANRERLFNAEWLYAPNSGRNFNSTYGINDSAIGLYWDNTFSASFYVSASDSFSQPVVHINSALYASAFNTLHALPAVQAEKKTELAEPSVRTDTARNDSVLPSFVETGDTADSAPQNVPVDIVIPVVVDQKEDDQKYITDLLRRINELSINPSQADTAEITRLTAEINAVMKRLGIE